MKDNTTINIKKMTREILRKKRRYQRETYDEIIKNIVDENNELANKVKKLMKRR
jgi:formiminotetrahydrofolate cyclodeaminase